MFSQHEVDQLNWFHKMTFPNGVITKGADNTPLVMSKIHLPADLTGKSVIDLGALDGAYSFECEKRGATNILAVDHFNWGCGYYEGNRKACFEMARKAFNSKVRDLEIDLNDINDKHVGKFDVVLFLGILYHVDNPIQVLKNARSMCNDVCIIETHMDLLTQSQSMTMFYPGNPTAGSRHWWGYNKACVEAMIIAAGFSRAECVEIYDHASGAKPTGNTGRGIFKAYV